jgi:hypothetical protein
VQSISFGAAGEYYYYPAIRTDAAGDLFTVFTRCSSSLFPQARFAARLSTDPMGTLRPTVQFKAGERSHTPAGFTAPYRWGDYMGAALDPAEPSKAWVVGEYAKNDGFVEWGTYISSVQFPMAVGGIAELPEMAGSPVGTPDSSSWGHLHPAVALASAVVVIGAGAWYARRRWQR